MHAFISPTYWLSEYEIKCFPANLHYIAHSSTRGFSTLTRAHGLMKRQEWLQMNGNWQLWYQESKSCKKFEFLPLMRADTYGREILKCSKLPGSYSPLFRKWFKHFLFLRARTCASWGARGHGLSVCWPMTWSLCVLNLVNLWWIVMKIWMIRWNHKIASKDDVMVEWSQFTCYLQDGRPCQRYCEYFKMKVLAISEKLHREESYRKK